MLSELRSQPSTSNIVQHRHNNQPNTILSVLLVMYTSRTRSSVSVWCNCIVYFNYKVILINSSTTTKNFIIHHFLDLGWLLCCCCCPPRLPTIRIRYFSYSSIDPAGCCVLVLFTAATAVPIILDIFCIISPSLPANCCVIAVHLRPRLPLPASRLIVVL